MGRTSFRISGSQFSLSRILAPMFGSYTLLAAASTTFFATLSSASKAYNKSAAYETGLQGASPVQKYVAATDFTP